MSEEVTIVAYEGSCLTSKSFKHASGWGVFVDLKKIQFGVLDLISRFYDAAISNLLIVIILREKGISLEY